MSKLECKDLSKSFSISGDTIEVLNNINLSITEGDKVAITGKSGAGKSTLLQILASLDSPTSGRVYLDNTDFASLSNDGLSQIRLHNFGFVYQFHHLLDDLSVEENISIPLSLKNELNSESKILINKTMKELYNYSDIEILFMHGINDDVIPIKMMEIGYNHLSNLNYNVDLMKFSHGHCVSEEQISRINTKPT